MNETLVFIQRCHRNILNYTIIHIIAVHSEKIEHVGNQSHDFGNRTVFFGGIDPFSFQGFGAPRDAPRSRG